MKNLTRSKLLLLTLIGSILMSISFPFTGSLTFLVFVSWIPLLIIENDLFTKKKKGALFGYSYLYFLIFNIGTTWWIWNASAGGAIGAFFLNALLMTFAFNIFSWLKRRASSQFWGVLFVSIWVSFEFLHFNWDLSWPWLTFGNYFSIKPELVQWYEYTGTLGGSVWVLTINYFLFQYFTRKEENSKKLLLKPILLFTIPSLFSIVRFYTYQEEKNPTEIVIAQPNIDPYNEKFDAPIAYQIQKLTDLIDEKVTPKTEFVLAPETALAEGINEEQIYSTESYFMLQKARKKWNQANLLIGASTYKFFDNKNSPASRKLMSGDGFYESYNTSLLLNEKNEVSLLHKSKLVLGVEKLPFIKYLPFLDNLSIDLGGAVGSLGVESEPKIFETKHGKIAPIICYESVYGDFVGEQVKKGAEILFVITNDGWWGNTPGYKQHFSFSQLRAIETRKSVARSANTGVSGSINQKGEVLSKTNYWVGAVQNVTLNKNSKVTFYARFNDYIGNLAVLNVLIILVIGFIRRRK